jgi:hypothetical protein
MDNQWAKITDSHWVNPRFGYVKHIGGDTWEANPKSFLGQPKTFKTCEECMTYIEKLNADYFKL